MSRIWNLKGFGGKPALLDEGGLALTYDELDSASVRFANAVGGRTLVFCLCRNSIGSIVGYVGAVNNGIVPLLLSADLEKDLLDKLIEVYRPSYIWLPSDDVPSHAGMDAVYEEYGYSLLSTGHVKCCKINEDLCLLLTTSGSTGSPKLVRQSYENVLSNASSIVEYLGIDDSERPITTLPMNYTYGLSIINSHLLVGATILVTEKGLMQREFWQFFRDEEATSFGGVPYTYEMLDRLRFYRMDLPSLRTLTQAGGKILPELHEKFARYAEDTGKQFVVMYGQCEATARMGFLPAIKALEKKGSMGVAIPGGVFHLVDANGKEIHTPNTTGELVYEGKNVTLGYAECAADLAKGDERNGVLQTGDMAQFDEEGYFYIVGRKKRFLKIYGNRVNLDEVDRMVKGELGVEVASTGEDDHMYLFVTDEKVAENVRDLVIAKTRLNPAAFKVVTIDEIPKNDAGKTLYKELMTLVH